MLEKLKFELEKVENIVGKGENAGYQDFFLFPKCFQKAESVVLRTWEQEVAGSVPGSANTLSED